MPLLELNGLRKTFGKREVVKGVDLTVGSGEVVGLLGKNGAGKTTTFRMAIGMIRPSAGRVKFRGQDVTHMPMYRRARKGIGYLAQVPTVFRQLTVAENITAVLEACVPSPKERVKQLQRRLEEFGLAPVAGSIAGTLSGGERRRLELARALVTNPAVILFDEPFTGIDPIAVIEIQGMIQSLKQEGIGVLITDHNVRETLVITDRAYIMEEGSIWLSGTPAELASSDEARKLYLGEHFKL